MLPVYFKVLYQKVHKRKLEKGEALVADDEKNDENESGDFTLV